MAFTDGLDIASIVSIGVATMYVATGIGAFTDGFDTEPSVEFTSGDYVSSGVAAYAEGLEVSNPYDTVSDFGIPYQHIMSPEEYVYTAGCKVNMFALPYLPGDTGIEIIVMFQRFYGKVIKDLVVFDNVMFVLTDNDIKTGIMGYRSGQELKKIDDFIDLSQQE